MPMEIRGGPTVKELFIKTVLLGGVGAAALTGCGSEADGGIGQAESSVASTETTNPSTTQQSPIPTLEMTPSTMNYELCAQGWWEDEDGKRRPAVQEDPLVISVDGRCNTPFESIQVGMYGQPRQEGPAPIIVENGDLIEPICTTSDQWIQDIRGPAYGSDVWVRGVTEQGETGFIPEVNVGYVDEGAIGQCPV